MLMAEGKKKKTKKNLGTPSHKKEKSMRENMPLLININIAQLNIHNLNGDNNE